MDRVKTAIGELRIGEPTVHGRLSVYPLTSGLPESPLRYLLLEEGLKRKSVRIREVSEGGSVPELTVENRAELPVLVVDGEELVGAKQNRVSNLTMMIPPKKDTVVPVSCVEQGRWSYASREFGVTDNVQNARVRHEKMSSVRDSIRRMERPRADQGRVWSSLREEAEALEAHSPTGDMGAMFSRHRETLDAHVAAVEAGPEDVGAVFVVEGRRYGLDLFDQPATFAAFLPKLVRSYAIDGLGRRPRSGSTAGAAARPLLERIAAHASYEDRPALVGLGRDVGLMGDDLVGSALVVDDTVVHMTVFAEPDSGDASRGTDPADARRHAGYRQRRDALRRRFSDAE